MARKHVVAALILSLSWLVAGCGANPDVADIKAKMQAIQEKPQGKIAPLPEFKPAQTFTYAANQLRSPFVAPEGFARLQAESAKGAVKPDLQRSREYLEGFNLEGLTMVGTIQRPGAALQALILDPNGRVTRVGVGDHLGKNFGRVAKVTADTIALVEITPDGKRGWMERPRTMEMNRAGASR